MSESASLQVPASTPPTSYDTLPYPPYTFPATHIGRLAAIGRLFSAQTADPGRARVLEIGCGVGANLLAMAQLYPESDFIGVDISAMQIATGHSAIAATGLVNVRLLQGDISNLGEDLGTFDYIIAHGIFSWVPDPVRQAIFEICRRSLHASGICYISYNCLPGWRMRGALRDMMIMHTTGIPDLPGKVAQGKALIRFLSESCLEETPYGKYLRQELKMLENNDDSYIAHEFFEEENQAFYFTDFLKAAGRHQLSYLADAELPTMITENLPNRTAGILKSMNLNLLATEQYMDFVRNRMFRSTLLCHSGTSINRNIDPGVLSSLHVFAPVSCKQEQPHEGVTVFVSGNGMEFPVQDAFAAKILQALIARGRRTIFVPEFLDEMERTLGSEFAAWESGAFRNRICSILLQACFQKIVEFFGGSPSRVMAVKEGCPQALPLARWQAANGVRISTPFLDMIQADVFVTKLLTLCDGTKERGAILQEMQTSHRNREFQLEEQKVLVTDTVRAEFIIERLCESSFARLSGLGILLPDPASPQ